MLGENMTAAITSVMDEAANPGKIEDSFKEKATGAAVDVTA